jgi:hypothetical protein
MRLLRQRTVEQREQLPYTLWWERGMGYQVAGVVWGDIITSVIIVTLNIRHVLYTEDLVTASLIRGMYHPSARRGEDQP